MNKKEYMSKIYQLDQEMLKSDDKTKIRNEMEELATRYINSNCGFRVGDIVVSGCVEFAITEIIPRLVDDYKGDFEFHLTRLKKDGSLSRLKPLILYSCNMIGMVIIGVNFKKDGKKRWTSTI